MVEQSQAFLALNQVKIQAQPYAEIMAMKGMIGTRNRSLTSHIRAATDTTIKYITVNSIKRIYTFRQALNMPHKNPAIQNTIHGYAKTLPIAVSISEPKYFKLPGLVIIDMTHRVDTLR